MRTVGVITTSRSDYSIYRPILDEIDQDEEMATHLVVGGSHSSTTFGNTVDQIIEDGHSIGDQLEIEPKVDEPKDVATIMARHILAFSEIWSDRKLDLILVLGDRYEMFAAVASAVSFRIPIAHLHGGEISEGAIDNSFRHAITKMSHLHFVATPRSRARVLQLGEEPWRVTVSGAPSLDNVRRQDLFSLNELQHEMGLSFDPPPLLVTFHPVTLDPTPLYQHLDELLEALSLAQRDIVFTYPNADTQYQTIVDRLNAFSLTEHKVCKLKNCGPRLYYSLMKYAAAMVGNSSSGILEAASFELPVVDVGLRQRGREHGQNVTHVACDRSLILRAIEQATEPDFRASLNGLSNPYGDGYSAKRIVDVLRSATLDDRLIIKRFHEGGLNAFSLPPMPRKRSEVSRKACVDS